MKRIKNKEMHRNYKIFVKIKVLIYLLFLSKKALNNIVYYFIIE